MDTYFYFAAAWPRPYFCIRSAWKSKLVVNILPLASGRARGRSGFGDLSSSRRQPRKKREATDSRWRNGRILNDATEVLCTAANKSSELLYYRANDHFCAKVGTIQNQIQKICFNPILFFQIQSSIKSNISKRILIKSNPQSNINYCGLVQSFCLTWFTWKNISSFIQVNN